MTSLHPHWQATDEGVPIAVHGKNPLQQPLHNRRPQPAVSRRPAAVLGILLALGIGAVSYGILEAPEEFLGGAVMHIPIGREEPEQGSIGQYRVTEVSEEGFHSGIGEESEPSLGESPISHRTHVAIESRHLTASIPQNPHAVRAGTAPTPAVNENVVAVDVQERLHSGAPTPPHQPVTGASMLFAAIVSACGIAWVVHHRALTQI